MERAFGKDVSQPQPETPHAEFATTNAGQGDVPEVAAATSAPSLGSVRTRLLGRVIPSGLLILCAYLIFGGVLTREGIGLTAALMMLVMMFLRMPIFAALTISGLLGLWAVTGPRAAESALSSEAYDSVATWELSVLPMFIAMGLLLWKAGVTHQLYLVCRQWFSWLPGGLAVGTNAAGAAFAAVSGTTLGTVYALGRAGIPEMLRYGYDRRLAVGSVMMASLPGQLIPPSVGLIIYAGIAEVPVGPQLLAGALPGILVALLCCLMIVGISLSRPRMVGKVGGNEAPSFTWTARLKGLLGVWTMPVLMAIVLGGMYTGVLTATEAGAAGAFGALLITIWAQRRANPAKQIAAAIRTTVITAGAIFMLLLGASIFARMLSVTGIGPAFTNWVVDSELSRIEFLLLMFVAYLIMGMFMDPLSMMLLTVPLLIPSLHQLDVSLLWYGVFAVFMGEMAVITPPVGVLAFVMHGVTKDPSVNLGHSISLKDVFVSVAWFMPIVVSFVVLLIFFPEIATFLPDRSASG